MDRKTAETLMQGATRATLLAHLDEAYACGKKAAKDRLTGQESLFGDEEENDHEERSLKLDVETIANFKTLFVNQVRWESRSACGTAPPVDTSPEDDRIFWEYHRRMAKAGK